MDEFKNLIDETTQTDTEATVTGSKDTAKTETTAFSTTERPYRQKPDYIQPRAEQHTERPQYFSQSQYSGERPNYGVNSGYGYSGYGSYGTQQRPQYSQNLGNTGHMNSADYDYMAKMNAQKAENDKKRAAFRKTLAVGLVGAAVFGVSLGVSFGVAYNGSRNLFSKETKPFTFDNATNNDKDTADNVAMEITPANDDIIETISKVQDSIVNISIVEQQQGWFNQVYESEGAGSGIIYSEDSEKVYIVTNNHVVEDATQVSISISGDEQVKASLVGKDASADLAVVSVLKSDLRDAGIDSVTVAEFGDSDAVQVGEYVLAIGNAMGEGKTTTRGIISAQNKTINIDGRDMTMIQTDAAINPGNSGGALVNSAGQVIGINTAKYSSEAVEGTGFAIPVNSAKEIIEQLMENGTVDRPYLGITGRTVTDNFRQMYNIDVEGVYIESVELGSAAERGGIVSTDIITSIDGVTVKDIETLSSEISKHKSGDRVKIGIIRNGYQETEVTVTLKNMNDQF